jgi:hypothetical protein
MMAKAKAQAARDKYQAQGVKAGEELIDCK